MKQRNPKQASKAKTEKRPPISVKTQLRLWVIAGGRCQVTGCNEFLLRDNLTLSETNYSNIAHIVGAKRNGPRGDDPMPTAQRSKIGNLMLVCTKHHKLIDSKEHVAAWPKERLLACKRAHEKRIHWVTSLQDGSKTSVVRVRGKIGTQNVEIPFDDICDAVLPGYPADPEGTDIDLTQISQPINEAAWQLLALEVTRQIEPLYRNGVAAPAARHISVFALGPIPLLVHLGTCLSNKVPTELYQRHRATEKWKWNEGTERVTFVLEKISAGVDQEKVALILPLSGSIPIEDLPPEIRTQATVYKIGPANVTPTPMLISGRTDLHEFQRVYHEFLALLKTTHPTIKDVHLFPAVPAPIAVMCGRELLPKAHPSLLVYEFDKSNDGFKYALKVN